MVHLSDTRWIWCSGTYRSHRREWTRWQDWSHRIPGFIGTGWTGGKDRSDGFVNSVVVPCQNYAYLKVEVFLSNISQKIYQNLHTFYHLNTCTPVHPHEYMWYSNVYAQLHLHVHMYTHMHACTHTHAHMPARTHTHLYIYTATPHTRTDMHTQIHAWVYTCTHARSHAWTHEHTHTPFKLFIYRLTVEHLFLPNPFLVRGSLPHIPTWRCSHVIHCVLHRIARV